MYKSYYFLNRYILDLKKKIVGCRIVSVFSQERERLVFHLTNEEDNYLEISATPSQPYILLRNKYYRAKKNTIDFFQELNNSVISDLLIASDDRVILINTSNGEVYFAIRGQQTNIIYNNRNNTEAFLKIKPEILARVKTDLLSKEYLNFFNSIDKDVIKDKSIDEIRKSMPFVGKEISDEVKLRGNPNLSDSETLIETLNHIKLEKPVLYMDKVTGSYSIGFDKMKIFSGLEKEYNNNLISAFNLFFAKKSYYDEKAAKLRLIRNYLEKELKRITAKLNNLKVVIDKGNNEEELNKIANLLLININKINQGDEKIELCDIYHTGKNIIVKLDSKLSPNQNVNRYFDKARDVKINYEKSINIYTETEKYFYKLKEIEEKFKNINEISELDEIMSELKIKASDEKKEKDDLNQKFKHYIIDGKYNVYVGKDSTNNDLLTTKFAKQNDFWFHARSVSGSHVVLRVENTKEAVPKGVLKKVAALAAFHSKAKTSGLAPVSFTLKKYVIKRKGMPVGQVSLTKEEVLLVKPEIPVNCEFIFSENA